MSEVLTRPDRRTRILELHGSLSGSQAAAVIAREFGGPVSRSAVIALWNRAGLRMPEPTEEEIEEKRLRAAATARDRLERRRVRQLERRAHMGALRLALDHLADDAPKPEPNHSREPGAYELADLPRNGCLAPVNDAPFGKPHLFCGARPRLPGCAYCSTHAPRMFARFCHG